MRINLVSMRMRGHAGPSGYDRLADYLSCTVLVPPSVWTVPRRTLARCFRPLQRRSGSLWYHRDALYNELVAAWCWFRSSGQVFHFIYGENSYRYLGCLKGWGRRNAVVCSYHTPPDRFRELVRDTDHLRRLDGIVVMSTCQMGFFSDLVGPDRVHFVPHGIDVDHYHPVPGAAHDGEGFRCIFVGNHLRDFEALRDACAILERRDRRIRVTVVTATRFRDLFVGLGNVDFFSGVSDSELLGLYREADLMVLPLLDSTANNSLLEGMACGLPVVSTDLPGVRDYVNDDSAVLCRRSDGRALADAVLELREDPDGMRRMGAAARARSLEFDWRRIARRMNAVYENVMQAL